MPPGVTTGDVLLAQIVIYDGTATNMPSAPVGWTVIRHDAVSIGNKMTSWLYYKVASNSEPASYIWNIAPQYAAGVMGAWRGASSSPIDQSSGSTAGGGNPNFDAAPSLTPATNRELQVYFYGAQNFVAPTIVQPAAISARVNDKSTHEGFTLAFGDLAAPSGGTASLIYSASSSASGGMPVMTAQAVLLIPANSQPTPTASATGSPTGTATPTRTATPTMTGTATPLATSTLVVSPIVTATATAVPTPSQNATATTSATPIPVITFVAGGSLADDSQPVNTVTVSVPPGVQAGDVLLAQIAVYDATGTNVPFVPTGWTVIRHDAIGAGNKMTSWLYDKVAGASEPASYSWHIALQYAAGAMGAWRGAALSPIDQSSGTTMVGLTPVSAAAPSLTPSGSQELQVYFYGSQSFLAPTITEPGAITQRLNIRSVNEGFTLAFGDFAAPPAGTASTTYTAMASTSPGGVPVMTAQAVLLAAGP